MKKLWMFCTALLALAGASSAHAGNPCGFKSPKIMQEVRSPHRDQLTLLVAHRGLHAVLGSNDFKDTPENSLQAIKNADDHCVEMVELDVRITADGKPILSHDYNWGREVEVRDQQPCCYNPWNKANANPSVAGTDLSRTRNWTLRNSVSFEVSPLDEPPPTLASALDYAKSLGMGMVFMLDIKDKNALMLAWRVVVDKDMVDRVIFKISASEFPKPSLFQSFMSTHYVSQGATDAYYIHMMPVYNTENIRPNNAFGEEGGEEKIAKSAKWYKEWGTTGGSTLGNANFFMGAEFNMKKQGGILAPALVENAKNGENVTSAIFNPYREYIDSNQRNLYFSSDGSCCVPLSTYYFDGSQWGLPSDTTDDRTKWDFLKLHIETGYFNLVTTDNVLPMAKQLNDIGRRPTINFFR